MYSKSGLGSVVIGIMTLMFAAGAHAQSSVTLYGELDSGLLYLSKTQNASGGNGGKLIGFTNSGQWPTLFGLVGTEDLGGNLSAEFKLESGFDSGNGSLNNSNGNLFGRQAYVGLKGEFGEVKAGLQFSPFFMTLFELDPLSLSNFGSGMLILVNNAVITSIFNSNALSYTSPVIGGFQGGVMLALGGEPGNFSAGRQYSANLSYRLGSLTIDAAFYDGNPGGSTQTPPASTMGFEGRTIGATYSFGQLTAKASFTNYKVAGTGMDNNVFGGGFDYHLTHAVDWYGGVWYVSNRDDTSSHSIMGSLGSSYSLSKATTLYAQVGVVNNHGSANLGLEVGEAPTSLYAPAGTTVGTLVGIRHVF